MSASLDSQLLSSGPEPVGFVACGVEERFEKFSETAESAVSAGSLR